ncbi:MAG: hypothetical protein GY940_47595 [bacterium]|nr:hypothetical protein [bacterium]
MSQRAPFVSQGVINPYIYQGRKVTNFLSNRPLWHPNIDAGFREIPFFVTMTHVKGWTKGDFKDHIQTWPGHDFNTGEINVRTVKLAGSSMGYWINVDGLVIFYAGDSTCSRKEDVDAWFDQVKIPVKEWGKVDIAVLPVHGSRDNPETIAALKFIKELEPGTVFPLYCGSGKHYYREFDAEIKKADVDTIIHYAKKPGQRFNF